jgi:hypothetical protein
MVDISFSQHILGFDLYFREKRHGLVEKRFERLPAAQGWGEVCSIPDTRYNFNAGSAFQPPCS